MTQEGAPRGEIYEYEGVQYHIQPRIMSRASIDRLIRLFRHQARESLAELYRNRSDLPEEAFADQKEAITKASVCPGFEEGIRALQTPEGLVVALDVCCDEIESAAQARELIGRIPNMLPAFEAAAKSMAEDVEAAKNSLPRGQIESPDSK